MAKWVRGQQVKDFDPAAEHPRRYYFEFTCSGCGRKTTKNRTYADRAPNGCRSCSPHTFDDNQACINTAWHLHLHGAISRGYSQELTFDQWMELSLSNCYYCDPSTVTRVNSKTFVRNGIDRKDNSIGYTVENCVPCCFRCNKMKKVLHHDEFIAAVVAIYRNLIGDSNAY